MRIGVMAVTISLLGTLPATLQAQQVTSSPTAEPAATAQAAPAATPPRQAAPPLGVTQSAPVAQADSSVNLDEIVCRSSPPPTGSRLGGGRECHTVRQWNERQRQDQQMLEMQQRMNSKQGG